SPCGHQPKYCRCLDNLKTKHKARWHARADLRQMNCDADCDFKLGFEQAYVDVALGGSGEVPGLPPQNYWKEWARTPEGHQAAQSWFAGYAAGAPQAKSRYEPYNEVASSGQPGYEWNPRRQ